MPKYRMSFVTNSSSSSFVISKRFLTGVQIEKIRNHAEDIEKYDHDCDKADQWTITETVDEIGGHTWMDNFSMWHYLIDLGIPADVIRYEED